MRISRQTFLRGALSALALPLGARLAQAARDPNFIPVKLAPIKHERASLDVTGLDGATTTYDQVQLEELPTYALTAKTPWLDKPARFEGILLNDLLDRHGLASRPIEVVAENDFAVVIDPEVLAAGALLVATRVDGHAHTRRARGPIQFVAPDEVLAQGIVKERHLVWMAAQIHPVS